MNSRRVAVFHVTDTREHAPGYQQVVDGLNASVLATIESLGWRADLHATADSSLQSSLRLARNSDLIVVLGGEDVHPDFYGGPLEYTNGGAHNQAADEAQLEVIRDAATRAAPVLGICRGHQVINVAFGGDLIQHLEGDEVHRYNRPGAASFIRHSVDVTGGLLAPTIRPGEEVQSSHHQAVARLGKGLTAAATSSDGIIEAVAHTDLPIVGVQWHPEHHGAPTDQLGRLLRHFDARVA